MNYSIIWNCKPLKPKILHKFFIFLVLFLAFSNGGCVKRQPLVRFLEASLSAREIFGVLGQELCLNVEIRPVRKPQEVFLELWPQTHSESLWAEFGWMANSLVLKRTLMLYPNNPKMQRVCTFWPLKAWPKDEGLFRVQAFIRAQDGTLLFSQEYEIAPS